MVMPRRDAPALVSVIIPVYNRAELLRVQLAALAEQDYRGPWEVLVADNGSTDGYAAVAASFADRLPNLRIVDAHARRGVSQARNQAVEHARGEFLVFCDADDAVAPQWLTSIADAARQYDVVGATFDDGPLNDAVRRSWFSGSRSSDGLPRHLGFLPFTRGACIGVWRSVYDDIGGFDESYPGAGEDAAFSWRAQLASYSVGLAPGAVVAYRFRTRARDVWRQARIVGEGQARLYAQFRAHGLRRSSTARAVAAWVGLLATAPLAGLDATRRGRWARAAGIRCGRLTGSARCRVWFP